MRVQASALIPSRAGPLISPIFLVVAGRWPYPCPLCAYVAEICMSSAGFFHRRSPAQRHTIRASRGCGCTIVTLAESPTSRCIAAASSRCVRILDSISAGWVSCARRCSRQSWSRCKEMGTWPSSLVLYLTIPVWSPRNNSCGKFSRRSCIRYSV
ncbi:hypothetical protein PF003_g37409 [Phytophthora fragariae]|nr:hypothetical protein PF003_g37409 [Phytophthora fragariae]